MSYILDALKKSEEERRRGSPPDPHAVESSAVRGAERRSLWPYLILIALLLNASVFAVWFGIGRVKREYVSKPPALIVEPLVRDRASSRSAGEYGKDVDAIETEARRDNAGSLKPEGVQENLSVRGGRSLVKMEEKEADSHAAPVARSGPAKVSNGATEARRTATETNPVHEVNVAVANPTPSRVYAFHELPLSMRQALPELSVSVFFYSEEPASRMARVNGHTLREGESMPPGLKLEQIVPGGLIFRYQDYRFRVSLR